MKHIHRVLVGVLWIFLGLGVLGIFGILAVGLVIEHGIWKESIGGVLMAGYGLGWIIEETAVS